MSTEAYYNERGEIEGFANAFSQWLTELFDIEFKTANCEFADLFASLEAKTIDFAGGIAPTRERREMYYMTDPIVERTLKYYLLDGTSLSAIQGVRPLRLAFLEGSVTTGYAMSLLEPGAYEPVFIQYNEEAYDLIKTGKVDAFVHQNTTDVVFMNHREIVTKDFVPTAFAHVSLTAYDSELSVIISVVQKALQNGQLEYLTHLYNKGEQDYIKHKLFSRLTEEEVQYIKDHPEIPLAAEYSNYPISFYNKYETRWQGISHDVLDEISGLTGLKFSVVNDVNTEWPVLLGMLGNGEASIITELIRLEHRKNFFIWTDKTIMSDRPALISKFEYGNINLNEIKYAKIGVVTRSAYTELFYQWFPYHSNIMEYDDIAPVFDALVNGEIDMALLSEFKFLNLTHYQELVGYKVNYIFDNALESTFGFNRDERVLCSIIDKSLELIDIDNITNQWLRRNFDYRTKIVEAQRPLYISAGVLLLCVLVLVIILLVRKHIENKKLWHLQNAILTIITELIERRDGTTGGHIIRTQKYLECLINKCIEKSVYANEIKSWDKKVIVSSSKLHDIGKIAIVDDILKKPDKLTDEEFAIMKTHTSVGSEAIDKMSEIVMDHNFFKYAKIFAQYHHEKWNGNGYPNKAEGLEIPLEGRLMAIVDVYDALVSERPYKKALTHEQASEIIYKDSGSHFDPELIRIFKLAKDEFKNIRMAEH